LFVHHTICLRTSTASSQGTQTWCVVQRAFEHIAHIDLQTLAVDLLHPSQESEQKKHKLKRLVQSPNSYFMDVKCPGASPSSADVVSAAPCAGSLMFLIFRLLCHHHRLLACANRRRLPFLHKRAVPAHWWKGQAHRGCDFWLRSRTHVDSSPHRLLLPQKKLGTVYDHLPPSTLSTHALVLHHITSLACVDVTRIRQIVYAAIITCTKCMRCLSHDCAFARPYSWVDLACLGSLVLCAALMLPLSPNPMSWKVSYHLGLEMPSSSAAECFEP